MPNVALYDIKGQNIGDIALSENVFGQPVNTAVMHEVVVAHLANCRQGTQSAKTRSEVSGGGKKPWRQKGTGRARQGSTRAPQWTHGGVSMGPKPRTYRVDLNKKVKRLAMQSALSSKLASGELIVVDAIKSAEYKTKNMVNMLSAIGAAKKSLVVLSENDPVTRKCFSNIEKVKTSMVNTLNVYDILNCDSFVVTSDAAKAITEVYA